jgi:hypothetical protein
MTGRMMMGAALVAAALCGGALGQSAAQTSEPERLAALSGIWASPAPEPWYGGWGTREFRFEDGRWGLVFTHALDREMRQHSFVFRTEGPWRLGQPSAVVPGAFEAVFDEERKLVTLMTGDPRLIAAFGFAACSLVTGVEVDISDRGCAGWKPVAQCREDHDLLALSAEGLHFGVRPRDNDMCTPDRRPTALLPAVVPR